MKTLHRFKNIFLNRGFLFMTAFEAEEIDCYWRTFFTSHNRDLTQTTTATATKTSPNERFEVQNNSCIRAL